MAFSGATASLQRVRYSVITIIYLLPFIEVGKRPISPSQVVQRVPCPGYVVDCQMLVVVLSLIGMLGMLVGIKRLTGEIWANRIEI